MGMGSPEPKADQDGTQVENLCYWGHRLKTCATGGTQAASLCYEGTTTRKRETPLRLTRDGVCFVRRHVERSATAVVLTGRLGLGMTPGGVVGQPRPLG